MQRDLAISQGFDTPGPARKPQRGPLSGTRARVKVLDPMTSIGPSFGSRARASYRLASPTSSAALDHTRFSRAGFHAERCRFWKGLLLGPNRDWV